MEEVVLPTWEVDWGGFALLAVAASKVTCGASLAPAMKAAAKAARTAWCDFAAALNYVKPRLHT